MKNRIQPAFPGRRLDSPLHPAPLHAALADKVGQRGIRYHGLTPVVGIDPVDGWRLCALPLLDSDNFWMDRFVARGDDVDVMLDTSGFRFTPSQARFAWLVRNGFPPRPQPFGGWDDTDIEDRIQQEAASCAA